MLVFHCTDTHLYVFSLTLSLPVVHNKNHFPPWPIRRFSILWSHQVIQNMEKDGSRFLGFLVFYVFSSLMRDSRRFSDPRLEDSLSDVSSYGYGGGAATSGTNVGFIRDSRMGVVWRDEDETWAEEDDQVPPLPILSRLVAPGIMYQVRCVLSTLCVFDSREPKCLLEEDRNLIQRPCGTPWTTDRVRLLPWTGLVSLQGHPSTQSLLLIPSPCCEFETLKESVLKIEKTTFLVVFH